MPRIPRTNRCSFAWATILRFANARPTADNWAAVLLRIPGLASGGRTWGMDTVDEVHPILNEFRRVLATLVHSSPDAAERSMVLELVNERAKAILKGWTWDRGTGRVFPQIRTENASFEEFLYAQLATAMTVEPYTSIRQCRLCQRFFYEPRQSAGALCSAKCRIKDAAVRAARYREEHPDEYREYQRKLMAKRRARTP